jgi:hypothetical protein
MERSCTFIPMFHVQQRLSLLFLSASQWYLSILCQKTFHTSCLTPMFVGQPYCVVHFYEQFSFYYRATKAMQNENIHAENAYIYMSVYRSTYLRILHDSSSGRGVHWLTDVCGVKQPTSNSSFTTWWPVGIGEVF